MYINQFEGSDQARLNQILHTLATVHGINFDFDITNADATKELLETKQTYEKLRVKIIKESAFNSYQNNPEYTKSILILEAVRILLTEIAPKRRRYKKVKESVDISEQLRFEKNFGVPEHEVRVYRDVNQPTCFVIKLYNNDIENKKVAARTVDSEDDVDAVVQDLMKSQSSENKNSKIENLANAMINFKSPEVVKQNAFNSVGQKLLQQKNTAGLSGNDMRIISLAQREFGAKPVKEKIKVMQAHTGHRSVPPGLDNVHEAGIDEELNENKGQNMSPVRKRILENALHQQQDYEYQASMARSELYRNAKYAMSMLKQIDPYGEVPPWIAGNLTKAANYLDKIFHYLDYYKKFEPEKLPEGMDEDLELGETSGGTSRENLMLITEYSIKLFNMIQPGDKLEGWVAMKLTTASECLSSCKHYLDYVQFEQHGLDDHFDEARRANKKKMEESKLMEAETAQDLQKAKTILTAKEMSDSIQKIAETVAKLSVEDLMPLIDNMRTMFGTDAANGYNEVVKAALEELLNTATKTKETIDQAVSAIQSGTVPGTASDLEAAPAPTGEPTPDLGGGEPGAEEPAAAPEEPLGRAKKEVSESTLNEKWDTEMHTAEKDKGKWDGYTVAELKAKKAKLMKKEKRSAAEQKTVKQIDFAIRAKQKNKWGKIKEGAINEKSPPGKKAEDWIKSNKKRFIDQYGKKKGMSVLYAKAWKMFGESSETFSNAKTIVENRKKVLDNLNEQFNLHKTQFAQLVKNGQVKDPLAIGFGLEGELLQQQINTVQKEIAESQSIMAYEIKVGIIKLVEQLQNVQKADKLSAVKLQTPYGVLYTRNGKPSKKMFESADTRSYWLGLNSDEISNVKLVEPETFDQAIDLVLKGK